MDQLPLADEIREARRLCDEAQAAHAHLLRLQALMTSLRLLESDAVRDPDLAVDVPGDDVLDSLRETWPQLRDLREPPTHNTLELIRSRKLVAQSASHLLQPFHADSNARHAALHHLQQQQQLQVQGPEHAELVAEVRRLQARRETVEAELRFSRQRLETLDPLCALVRRVLQDTERLAGEAEGPGVLEAVIQVVAMQLDALRSYFQAQGLSVRLPAAPTSREDLAAIADRLRRMLDELGEEEGPLRARIDALDTEYRALTEKVLGMAG